MSDDAHARRIAEQLARAEDDEADDAEESTSDVELTSESEEADER